MGRNMSAAAVLLTAAVLHGLLALDQKKATSGDTVILPCRSADSRPVVVVEWDRTDLESGHVLLFRDDQIYPDGQLPSFKNRVDLQDRQMKDGDVSLLLNNVTTNDSGTYECRVAFNQSNKKRSVLKSDPISTVQLQVSPPPGGPAGPGQDGGPGGLIVALVVLGVILVLIPAVIVIIVRRRLPRSSSS